MDGLSAVMAFLPRRLDDIVTVGRLDWGRDILEEEERPRRRSGGGGSDYFASPEHSLFFCEFGEKIHFLKL